MTLDLLDAKRIEAAGQHYLGYKDDREAREAIRDLVDRFHDSAVWEKICNNAEDQIVDQIKAYVTRELPAENAMSMHVTMMALISVAFVAGFDAGYQLQIDTTIEKLGGLS